MNGFKVGDVVDVSGVYSTAKGPATVVEVVTGAIFAEDSGNPPNKWCVLTEDAHRVRLLYAKGGVEEVNTQPEGLGARKNSGKPELSMVLEARAALIGGSRVLMFGCDKYARCNWLQGMKHTPLVDSLMRHLVAWQAGEDLDEDSGLPHVDHVLVNALFLSEMYHTRPDLDDRPLAILRGHRKDITRG